MNILLKRKYPLFFYEKYFFLGVLKKNSRLNYYMENSYSKTSKKSLVFKFITRKLQIVTFLPSGLYFLSGSHVYAITRTYYFSSLIFFIFNIISGFFRRYKSKLFLIGLRVRIEKIYKKSIIMKLNLCHKIKWKCAQIKLSKFRKIKNAFILKTKDFYVHNLFLFLVRRFKLPDIYKGNGIRFYKEKLKFKKRKQFGVF